MRPLKVIATALAIFTLPLAACSEEVQPAQKEQIEKVVRDYLIENPEVVIEAIKAFQRNEEAAADARRQDAMKVLAEDLNNNPNDPVIGNPDGDVTVVEFFDYRCSFCKKVFPDIQKLLKDDGNIRYVLKEWPILGKDSVFASRAAMAVWLHQKDKYQPFHVAMMTSRGALSGEKVLDLAQSVGVDLAALKDQMDDPLVARTLEGTSRQAQLLNITGTPAFVIGGEVQGGAIPLSMMKELVAAARQAK